MLGLVFQERRKSPDMLQQHTACSRHSLLSQLCHSFSPQTSSWSAVLAWREQTRVGRQQQRKVQWQHQKTEGAPRPQIWCLSTDWPPCRGICLPKWQLRTNLMFTHVIPLVLILVFFFPFNTQKSSPGTSLVAQ